MPKMRPIRRRTSLWYLKVYSNEFHCFVLEEVLKILALNVGMAYVVDQANVMYANLDHDGLLPLFVL